MDSNDQAVNEAESPAATDESGAVSPQGTDRPLQNTIAEFNRKFSSVSNELAASRREVQQVLQYLTAQQQPPQQTHKKDDLYEAATQGDRDAFYQLARREAAQVVAQQRAEERAAAIVQNQIQAIYAKYPQLTDQNDPLAQWADRAYRLLVSNGYPQNATTVLDAMKTAITDRPDLVTATYNQGAVARDTVRRSASQYAQTGVTGTAHRQSGQTQTQKPRLTTDEVALSKRMGIKDPAAAKARFLKRQEEGLSRVDDKMHSSLQNELENF